jgi:hypothetical protein
MHLRERDGQHRLSSRRTRDLVRMALHPVGISLRRLVMLLCLLREGAGMLDGTLDPAFALLLDHHSIVPAPVPHAAVRPR